MQPEDHEEGGGGGKILEVDARGAAEIEREQEERDVLGDGDQQGAGNVVDAVGEGHQQRDRHDREVEYDDRRQQAEVHEHLLDGIDERDQRDQVGRRRSGS